jgi:DNA (cytosine-5)-methyltransferase 1
MGYPEPIFAWRSKFHDFLYKVDPASPCRTIKANPGKFTGPFHWKNRHFTLEELKRLQAFPDDYGVVGTYAKVVEQIGNSVPPLLAEVIAKSVREQLIDHSATMTNPVRPPGFASTFRQRQRDRTNHFKAVAGKIIGKRFGNTGRSKAGKERGKRSSFYVTYEGFFGKKLFSKRPPRSATEDRAYKGLVNFDGDNINLLFARLGKKNARRITIEIGGLHEGLTSIHGVVARAEVPDLTDIFFLWDAIEDALILNSKFLTLIDIYGHYANRGDTVTIKTDVFGGAGSTLRRAICFFGDSRNCGVAVPKIALQKQFGINEPDLDELITDLRAIRFDIRTRRTHPTIAPGMALCTYPFPLLSDRAHLERRLKLEPAASSSVPNRLVQQGSLFE